MPRSRKKPHSSLPAASADALAAEALDFLQKGKFRKARETAKRLAKQDRSRATPILIEANQRLAQAMLEKGQISEARQVIEYLKTFAPPGVLKALELKAAAASGDWGMIGEQCASELAEDGANLPEAERIRLADRVVMAFDSLPAEGRENEGLIEEARAVQGALQALCEARWKDAADRLRRVPRRSFFGHWTYFIKGVSAFHQGEWAKATRLFQSVPSESALSRAAAPWQRVAANASSGPTANGKWDPLMIDGLCQLAGEPRLGQALDRAEQLWKQGNHLKAYETLREAVPEFPGTKPDFLGVLRDLFHHAIFHLSPESTRRLSAGFRRIVSTCRHKNQTEREALLRVLARDDAESATDSQLNAKTAEYLRFRRQTQGEDPRFEAIVHFWLAEQFSEEPEFALPFSLFRPIGMRNPEEALRHLCKTIELDPSHIDSYMALCHLYEKEGNTRARNRLLDQMTQRFPDRKEVLLRAGNECLLRRVFNKGLDYLERAAELDPLDPSIPRMILTLRIRHARHLFQKRQCPKARALWKKVMDQAVETPHDFRRSEWTLKLRHGILEKLHGDAAQGDRLLAEARTGAPSDALFTFFHLLSDRVLKPKRGPRTTVANGAPRCETGGHANLAEARRLMDLHVYWRDADGFVAKAEDERFLQRYLAAALKQPFTRADAKALVTQARKHAGFGKLAQMTAKRVMVDDPRDPWFRLYQLEQRIAERFIPNRTAIRAELRIILEEAIQRRDDETLQRSVKLAKAAGIHSILDRPPTPPRKIPPPRVSKRDAVDNKVPARDTREPARCASSKSDEPRQHQLDLF